MKKVYDNLQPLTLVGHFQSLLEDAGIPVHIKNENSHVAMGEVPQIEIAPEIWVIHDEDYDKAVALIKSYQDDSLNRTEQSVTCTKCKEESPGTFLLCWNCSEELPAACHISDRAF